VLRVGTLPKKYIYSARLKHQAAAAMQAAELERVVRQQLINRGRLQLVQIAVLRLAPIT